MSTDDLTLEVHKLFMEKEKQQEYFNHIAETIEDHTSKLTALTQLCGRLVTSVQAADNKITQNETLTINNDSQLRGIQAGLALIEAQVTTNAAATAELRTDVQNAVATVVQETH